MNVIIYARVSTVSQDVQRQINDLKEYAVKEKLNVIDTIFETVSGKIEFKKRRLNEVLDQQNIQGILVWELTRLGRDSADILNILKLLNKEKIWVYFKKENLRTLDLDLNVNTNTQLLLTIMSGIALSERTTTVERSVSGLQNTVKQGNWTGGVFLPFGYKREDKRLVINEEEADVVRIIFNLCVDNKFGSGKIADYLNYEEVKTRYNTVIGDREINTKAGLKRNGNSYKWADGTVYNILTNPIYVNKKYGKKGSKLEGIKFEVPPIISEEIFNKTAKQLSKRSHKAKIKFDYLLENIEIKCGVCGMTYYPHKRISNKDNTYKCLSIRYHNNCGNIGIGIPKLDSGVWTAIVAKKDNIDSLINSNKDVQATKEKFRSLYAELQIVKSKKGDVILKKEKILDLYVDNVIDKRAYQSKEFEFKKELSKIENEILRLDNEIHYTTQVPKAQKDVSSIIEMYKNDKGTLSSTLAKLTKTIKVFPLHIHNLKDLYSNKQDNVVMISLFTVYDLNEPINFLVSQRSDKIYFVKKGDRFIKPQLYSEIESYIKKNENKFFVNTKIKKKENYPYTFIRDIRKKPTSNQFRDLDMIEF